MGTSNIRPLVRSPAASVFKGVKPRISSNITTEHLSALHRIKEALFSLPGLNPEANKRLNIAGLEVEMLQVALGDQDNHHFAAYLSEELFNHAVLMLREAAKETGSAFLADQLPSSKKIRKDKNVVIDGIVDKKVLSDRSLDFLGWHGRLAEEGLEPKYSKRKKFLILEGALFRACIVSDINPPFGLVSLHNNFLMGYAALKRGFLFFPDMPEPIRQEAPAQIGAPVTLEQVVVVESPQIAAIREKVTAMILSDPEQRSMLLNAAISLADSGAKRVENKLREISGMYGSNREVAIIRLALLASIADSREAGLTDIDRRMPRAYAFDYVIEGSAVSRRSSGGETQIVANAYCSTDETAIILVDQAKMPWLTNNKEISYRSVYELGGFFTSLWLYLDLLRRGSIKNIEIRVLSENGININFQDFLRKFFLVSGVTAEQASRVLTFCHRTALDSDPARVLRGAQPVARAELLRDRGEIKKTRAQDVFDEIKAAILKSKVMDADDERIEILEIAVDQLFSIKGFVESVEEFVHMVDTGFSGENPGKVVIGWVHEVLSLGEVANHLVQVNAHPRPIDYVPLRVDASGNITGRGATRREGVEIEIDGVFKDGTWFETKRKMNFRWLQEGESDETEELEDFLSQARKYAQALREGRAPALVYRLTTPKIHPNALKEIRRAFGDQAHKVAILHYINDLSPLEKEIVLAPPPKASSKKPTNVGGRGSDSPWSEDDAKTWLWLAQNCHNPPPKTTLDAESAKQYSSVRGAFRHVQLMAIKAFLMDRLKGREDERSRQLRAELSATQLKGDTLSKTLAQRIAMIAQQIRETTN